MSGPTAQMKVIDLGTVELNDLILGQSVIDLAETQNATYRDSRSVLLSFVETAGSGWEVFNGTGKWMRVSVDIPDGIDRILLTTRGENAELDLQDVTAGVTMANHSHTSPENTLVSTYVLPGSGLRTFNIEILWSGYVRQVLFEWDSTLLP